MRSSATAAKSETVSGSSDSSLAENRGRASDDADVLLETAQDDASRAPQHRVNVLAQRFETGIEKHRSDVRQSAADHDEFRIEHLDDGGERDPEIPAGGDDEVLRDRIAAGGDFADQLAVDELRVIPGQIAQGRLFARLNPLPGEVA